jgi:16S rRNA (cytosine967-C5)-methyltransferase
VLRGFLRDGCAVPYPKDPLAAMSVEYAAPTWLIRALLDALGEAQTKAFLSDALQPAPRFIRRNSLRCTKEELEEALGTQITPVSLVPDAYLLHAGEIRGLEAFQKGWFYVQDLSSQICALSLGAKPGETVLDLCAAPGGKTCTIAISMENKGKVFAFDLMEHRVKLIEENVSRLGLDCVTGKQGDATKFQSLYAGADRVLCDVPCSGIGVLRRKPEIKEKAPESLEGLPKIQLAILENGARYVKPGGILQYSTCTILPEENQKVVARFLSAHPEFQPVAVNAQLGAEFMETSVTLLPELYGGDGFFVAKFQKTGVQEHGKD